MKQIILPGIVHLNIRLPLALLQPESSNRLPALAISKEKVQRSILYTFTFEKLCNSHTLCMFHIRT